LTLPPVGRDALGRQVVALDPVLLFEADEDGAVLQGSAFKRNRFRITIAAALKRKTGPLQKRSKSRILYPGRMCAIVG
jgi:hypothetical protein